MRKVAWRWDLHHRLDFRPCEKPDVPHVAEVPCFSGMSEGEVV
jgi:hypothetical protein